MRMYALMGSFSTRILKQAPWTTVFFQETSVSHSTQMNNVSQ